MRIGNGFDVHRLVEGRKLVLGGVLLPHPKGLLGHSDADVLIHAIMDALLGAIALGDIGGCFPDSDPQYKNADSRRLLQEVGRLVSTHGFLIGNLDTVIIAETPRLAPYILKMRQNISDTLAIEIDRVSIKATTTERLGFIGRGEGIAAQAVALLMKASKQQ
jgi:2-C-methyl-D-erythritol 2,4-cyclodiphosphate synthase